MEPIKLTVPLTLHRDGRTVVVHVAGEVYPAGFHRGARAVVRSVAVPRGVLSMLNDAERCRAEFALLDAATGAGRA